MTANDSKSYLDYLNKLVDQYNNTHHRSIDKKPVDGGYFALTGDIKLIHKAPKFKVWDRVKIVKYNNTFSKGDTVSCSIKIFFIDSLLEINSWTCKNKDSNWEKIIGSFYDKESLLSKL